jgi:hypothetical protein
MHAFALTRDGSAASASPLSAPAQEVLGTLAACTWNGPHRAKPLRRWTRLTPAAFDEALAELARTGLVQRQDGDVFWVTAAGESWTRRLFT